MQALFGWLKICKVSSLHFFLKKLTDSEHPWKNKCINGGDILEEVALIPLERFRVGGPLQIMKNSLFGDRDKYFSFHIF